MEHKNKGCRGTREEGTKKPKELRRKNQGGRGAQVGEIKGKI